MDRQRRYWRWTNEHHRAIAIGLALLAFAFGLFGVLFLEPTGNQREGDVLALALTAAASATLLWYRTKPLVALVAAVAMVIPYWVLNYVGGADITLLVVFYAATRHGGDDRRRVWQVVAVCFFIIMAVATVGVIIPTEELPAAALVGMFIVHGTFALIGEALYQRSQYIAQLEQRAASLEADMENKAALAAVEERTRVAREMHDIIAHGMTAIVVQAQAGQSVVDTNAAQTRTVLETIEGIGRDSVDEMRRMLGVLRDDNETAYAPQPTIDDLPALTDTTGDAGIEFALSIQGSRRPLAPGLELACYRVVQEAFTNALRHAGRPARVEATVDFGETELVVTVRDDGRGAAASGDANGTGHGLRGMRERVEIYGGTLRAGPRSGGGFEVLATFPLTEAVSP